MPDEINGRVFLFTLTDGTQIRGQILANDEVRNLILANAQVIGEEVVYEKLVLMGSKILERQPIQV
ncbi:snRNP Sm-like protein [Giardia muris]|uniref:SnRNP Sm-like protein n=1 Tax=Giardia muris TaxID=5742 RepID=A0A4Z1T2R1_GIAMU|nr:snRNP Sm-like protein [Giardia muris]|eukprot:TNJ29938.1 snRNP Sm-like protein [Giardia muris]